MSASFKDVLYDASPVFIQNVLISTQGAIFRHQRFGGKFRQNLKTVEDVAQRGHEELKDLQLSALKSFIQYAWEHSPYYRRELDMHNYSPGCINGLSDLQHIPVLSKETLRAQTDEVRATCCDPASLIESHTSGTTGSPITVGFTTDDMRLRFAYLYRMLRRFGVNPFDRSVRFSGRTLFPNAETNKKFWRMNYAANQLLVSSYNLKPENLDRYVEKIAEFNPILIDGYPSSIFVLARYINSVGKQGLIRPTLVMTTAETLEDYQREEIRMAFGDCSIANQYASSEGAPFITEDENGDLVVNIDTGVFEFVEPGTNKPARPGEQAELLVTSFTTHAYPLIRYRIGDLVELGTNELAQSWNMPTVKRIIGRQEDILYTPYAGYVGRLDPVFKKSPSSIVETQIVQTSPTSIVLKVVPDKNRFEEQHLEGILHELRLRLGDVTIAVEYHDALERGKNGKLRAVVGLSGNRNGHLRSTPGNGS